MKISQCLCCLRSTCTIVLIFLLFFMIPPQNVLKSSHRIHKPQTPPTLFEAIGGKKNLEKIIESFLDRCKNDPIIRDFFVGLHDARLKNFKKVFYNQLCAIFNGPCQYPPKTMKQVHSGFHIQKKHFDAFLSDFENTLAEFGVATQVRHPIMHMLGGMKKEIVEE